MFEKTLSDVVKGIRASKRDTALYISQCIADIKKEIHSTDRYVKANALNKLTFLQMMGYGMSWASFSSIEVMSSPRFAHKRIGYLAAQQGFTQDTEVILLTTNLLKKELRGAVGGSGVYESGLAINCISNIVTEDLGRDLLPELNNLTGHPKPYIRKKAILCLFKVFCKYPQGLRLTFDKIQQALEDAESSVVSCAVNVVTELSDKNPRNYLPLAPTFFSLLTTSQNNWMLIKVVKLLGTLVPEEPRLARKLLDPLASIVQSTQAKSLLYEAVYTITLCLPYCRKADGNMPANAPSIVQLCGTTLKDFCADSDPNLKYLGLVGFGSLMASHPKVLFESDARPLILACLSDEDITIRTRALDLLRGMTTRKNLQELIGQLMKHVEMASGQYKRDLVMKIVELCSGDKYALLQDFAWYLDVLLKLSYLAEDVGGVLEKQFTDVTLRVLPVRAYAVQKFSAVLLQNGNASRKILPQVLPSMAWAVGEYADLLEGTYVQLVRELTLPEHTGSLPTTTQTIYLHTAMKVLAAATKAKHVKDTELTESIRTLTDHLPVFMQSVDVEVQERAATALGLLCGLGLTSEVPGLSTLTDDEDDDDEADDDDDDGAAAGNLLDIGDMTAPTVETKTKKVNRGNKKQPSSLAARCREVAPTLNYVLKPDPMKPISAKAQKKKRAAPVGIDSDWLNAPAKMDIFSGLFDDVATSKPTMEQVNFTEQRLMQVNSPASLESSTVMMDTSGFGSTSSGTSGGPVSAVDQGIGSSTSFQQSRSFGDGAESSGLNQQRTAQDPFYLDSSPQNAPGGHQESPSRFGAISLLDDGDDDESRRTKKKKKKKSKRDVQGGANGAAAASIGAADLAIFAATDAQTNRPAIGGDVTMYDSAGDDGDDDDDVLLSIGKTKKRSTSREFAGLASVDLTTPLREDETMPTFEHRTVPESSGPRPSKGGKDKKAKKKNKKSKKDRASGAGVSSSGKDGSPGGVGDLLDLGGGFASVADVSNPTVQTGASSDISGMQDLLSLQSPTPAPTSTTTMVAASSAGGQSAREVPDSTSNKKGKKPWLKGIVKAANAKDGQVDWTRVRLLYRAAKSKQAASITVRVHNELNSPIQNLVVSLKGHSDVTIGDVPANGMVESTKIGPIPMDESGGSVPLKGSLVTGTSRVPIKVSIPASLSLTPTAGLTLDGIMEELSSQNFGSQTVKLDLVSIAGPKVKPTIASFFRASLVDDKGPLMGTLASDGPAGAKVRILVKVKESTVKVDIKCNVDPLLKALSDDLKKLML